METEIELIILIFQLIKSYFVSIFVWNVGPLSTINIVNMRKYHPSMATTIALYLFCFVDYPIPFGSPIINFNQPREAIKSMYLTLI